MLFFAVSYKDPLHSSSLAGDTLVSEGNEAWGQSIGPFALALDLISYRSLTGGMRVTREKPKEVK